MSAEPGWTWGLCTYARKTPARFFCLRRKEVEMTKPSERDVKSWVDASRYGLETARALLKSRRYLYVLFMCQQAIEKILKACATVKTSEFRVESTTLRGLGNWSRLILQKRKGSYWSAYPCIIFRVDIHPKSRPW